MSASKPRVGALILAGGTSSRMGRDKLALQRGGITLLDTVVQGAVDALHAISTGPPVVVVGPVVVIGEASNPESWPGVSWTRDQPPGGGPVAAIAAGLDHLGHVYEPSTTHADTAVVILAGDAPAGPEAIPLLYERLCDGDADGVVLVDGDGRRQPLCAIYREDVLREALASFGETHGTSLHALLEHLRLVEVIDNRRLAADIDTPVDAHRFGFYA